MKPSSTGNPRLRGALQKSRLSENDALIPTEARDHPVYQALLACYGAAWPVTPRPFAHRLDEPTAVDALTVLPEEEVWLASQKAIRARLAYPKDVAHFVRTLKLPGMNI